jgi:hypothetical protein
MLTQVRAPQANGKPVVVKFRASGLVYDAEYTWTVSIEGLYSSSPYSIKVNSPLLEQECTTP